MTPEESRHDSHKFNLGKLVPGAVLRSVRPWEISRAGWGDDCLRGIARGRFGYPAGRLPCQGVLPILGMDVHVKKTGVDSNVRRDHDVSVAQSE